MYNPIGEYAPMLVPMPPRSLHDAIKPNIRSLLVRLNIDDDGMRLNVELRGSSISSILSSGIRFGGLEHSAFLSESVVNDKVVVSCLIHNYSAVSLKKVRVEVPQLLVAAGEPVWHTFPEHPITNNPTDAEERFSNLNEGFLLRCLLLANMTYGLHDEHHAIKYLPTLSVEARNAICETFDTLLESLRELGPQWEGSSAEEKELRDAFFGSAKVSCRDFDFSKDDWRGVLAHASALCQAILARCGNDRKLTLTYASDTRFGVGVAGVSAVATAGVAVTGAAVGAAALALAAPVVVIGGAAVGIAALVGAGFGSYSIHKRYNPVAVKSVSMSDYARKGSFACMPT